MTWQIMSSVKLVADNASMFSVVFDTSISLDRLNFVLRAVEFSASQ